MILRDLLFGTTDVRPRSRKRRSRRIERNRRRGKDGSRRSLKSCCFESLEQRRLLAAIVQGPDLPRSGTTVAVDGNYLVIADQFNDPTGAAYVLERDTMGTTDLSDDTWVERATLTSTNPADQATFVQIDGDTIVVGSGGSTSLVYELPAGGWTGTLTETARLPIGGTLFNDANTLLFGTNIYERPATGWSNLNTSNPSATLTLPSGSLARSATDGNTVVIYSDDIFNGPAEGYVYVEPAGGWSGNRSPSATLDMDLPSNLTLSRVSLAGLTISDDTVVLPIQSFDDNFDSFYDVIIFERGASWSGNELRDARIRQPPSECDFDYGICFGFGESISLDDERLIVGAPVINGGKTGVSSPGKFQVYDKPATGWQTTSSVNSDQELFGFDDGSGFEDWGFGTSQTSGGDTYLLGSYNFDNVEVHFNDSGSQNLPPEVEDQQFSTIENTAVATSIGTVTATDPDLGPGMTLSYQIIGGNSAGALIIDSTSGELSVAGPLDFETTSQYALTVEVTDPLGATDTATITVDILDENEAPSISLANEVTLLPEETDTTSSLRVADIVLMDDALGTNVVGLSGADAASFVINGTELRIAAGTNLDFETQSEYFVTVEVDDASVGVSPDATVTFMLTLSDINESPASIALSNESIDDETDTTGGFAVGTLAGIGDPDGTQNHVFSVIGGSDAAVFSINGDQLLLDDGVIDLATQGSYAVEVQLDDDGLFLTQLFTIQVTDVSRHVIGDYVWFDFNANGIQDAGDSPDGLDGVTVRLLDVAGSQLQETVSNNGGAYFFNDIATGDYLVEFVTPQGFELSTANLGGDDELDSDADPLDGRASVTVSGGTDDFSIDAGFILVPGLASISGNVWEDAISDGLHDSSEQAVTNVNVTLLDDLGMTVDSMATDAGGFYQFAGLTAGNYQVEFELPNAAYTFTLKDQGINDAIDSDVDIATGRTNTISLLAGEAQDNTSAGLILDQEQSSIEGLVWNDLTGDGIRDSGEPGLAGTQIVLLDATGTTTLRAVFSDAQGFYSFGGLAASTYVLEAGVLGGLVVSPQDQGSDDLVDSDFDVATKRTTVLVGVADGISSVDLGLRADPSTASFGGRVWHDLDRDGIQDAGEPGISDVTQRIYSRAGGGLQLVQTASTDIDGRYSFAGLPEGEYQVRNSGVWGFAATVLNQGTDEAVDSDTTGDAQVTLSAGQQVNDFDAGVVAVGRTKIYGQVRYQASGGPLAGTTVYLSDGNGTALATTRTGTFGWFNFNGLLPGDYTVRSGSSQVDVLLESEESEYVELRSTYADGTGGSYATVLGRVWHDANKNGQQDVDEGGLVGIQVNLLDTYGQHLNTATTDSNGQYLFPLLAAGNLGRTYKVQVLATGGYHFSPINQTNDLQDSDFNAAGRGIAFVNPANGVAISRQDAGLHLNTSTIGDSVWEDRNGNGQRDPSEPGIDGVRVLLYDQTGVNLLASTTTDNGGHYFFGFGDVPGDYVVEVEPPLGFGFTSRDAGTDDRIDSDVDPVSGTVTISLTIEEAKTSIDAGLVRLTDPNLATISDFVWDDLNSNGLQDTGEPGLDGVIVELFADGVPIATAVTAQGGLYAFHGLSPAEYSLLFVSPNGYEHSPQGVGTDSTSDSDADLITGIADVTVTAGARQTDIDAGFVRLTTGEVAVVAGRAWNDVNGNGLQDAGEPGLGGVTASLFTNDPVFQIDQVQTDENGSYEFQGLSSGDYFVSFVTPFGNNPTVADQGADDSIDSDVDPLTQRTGLITVLTDDGQQIVDVGYSESTDPNAAILDGTVWDDENANGIQDAGEAGIDGVEVRLLNESGSLILATTTTVDGGRYRFPGLTTFDTMIEILTPFGYRYTSASQGIDGELDSDIDELTGRTGVVTLLPGQTESAIDAGLVSTPPNRIFVSKAFAAFLPGQDPDGPGPATFVGKDAFTNLADAITAVQGLPETIIVEVADGNYDGIVFDEPGKTLRLEVAKGGVIADMTVAGGTVEMTGVVQIPGGVTVEGAGSLTGIASIVGLVNVLAGGRVSPGTDVESPSIGGLETGNLTLNSGSSLELTLVESVAGVGHDQMQVNGSVDLDGSMLDLVIDASLPRTSFTLIANDGNDAILGQFSKLAEGARIELGFGQYGIISYVGGDGNDFTLQVLLVGDFNDDGLFTTTDIDALTTAIATNSKDTLFDVNGDTVIDLADRDAWLALAGETNLGAGLSYLLGDANLDGAVDGDDFLLWSENKFTETSDWSAGDFNADGLVDGFDFLIWNANKFQSSHVIAPTLSARKQVATARRLPKLGLANATSPSSSLASRQLRHDQALSAWGAHEEPS